MYKVHQNIILDGVDRGDGKERKDSAYCNEGKWDNFIAPLLPKDCQDMTFIEYGSNAGLYLRLAKERGFDRVVGLERSREDCKVAREYRDSLGLDYRIIHTNIHPKFDFNSLPIADVTLLANFHYHQHIDEFRQILNVLETRTCHVLVVSVNLKVPHWRAQAHQEDVQHYFRHWELVDKVPVLKLPDDPHPREMFSYLFKSPKVQRLPLNNIKPIGSVQHVEYKALEDFVGRCLRGEDFADSRHYRIQYRRRMNKWGKQKLDKYLEAKRQLILGIKENGMYTPLVLDRNYQLVDGLHRFLTIQQLGHKTAIARVM